MFEQRAMPITPDITPTQALERKLDYLAEMVGDVHELVERRSPNEETLRAAVRDGIVAAASDPGVWSVALATLRDQAQSEAGGWLFGGVRAFFSRVAWLCLIGLGVYLVGGWAALAAFIKTGATHP
jgi:hypothetical protein